VVLATALVGVVLHKGLRLIERRLLFWSGDGVRMIGS